MKISDLIERLQALPDSDIVIYDPQRGDCLAEIVDVVATADGRVILSQWPLETEDPEDPSPSFGGVHL